MIDLKFIRNNPDLVKENIKKKFQSSKLKLIDELLEKDELYRKYQIKIQELRHQRNTLSSEIGNLKRNGEDSSKLLKISAKLPEKLEELEKIQEELLLRISEIHLQIPNMIHESVPIGKDSTQNVEIWNSGKPKNPVYEIINHAEIATALGIADFEISAKTSGNGFYYLKGDLALLNMALINFARDYMVEKKYEYIEPPLMIRKNVLDSVYSSADIQAQSYKIEGEDLYLIATSEHPLIGMFIDKVLKKSDLPIKLTGFSPCFRKEIGSHGIDEKGLFRTHQFYKQEMVVICEPEDSYKFYSEMSSFSKEIFLKLELPIREIECCSGDLSDLKAKSSDLEAWSPRKKAYFEITSCTNMESAQSRRLNIRVNNGIKKYFPHTLNNTVIATSRAMVAILENYQNKDGTITTPKVLQPYMKKDKIIPKKENSYEPL